MDTMEGDVSPMSGGHGQPAGGGLCRREGGGAQAGRDRLDESIAEIFEIFSVNKKESIDVADVTVALRMLGMEVPQERFRKAILPEYVAKLTPDNRLFARDFKSIVVALRADSAMCPAVESLFSSQDRDKGGVLSLKSLQAINAELVSKGLENTEYQPDQIEAMVQGVFATDHITKTDYYAFLQR